MIQFVMYSIYHMIVYFLLYGTIIFQALINVVFHINWISKTKRVPLLLSFAYIFAFIWYASSVSFYIERANFLTIVNPELLDYISVLALSASLIFATYFVLMIKPVRMENDKDKNHYYFAFPIHLLMYVGLIILTSIFNLILSQFIK
jgi:hypothetical protein